MCASVSELGGLETMNKENFLWGCTIYTCIIVSINNKSIKEPSISQVLVIRMEGNKKYISLCYNFYNNINSINNNNYIILVKEKHIALFNPSPRPKRPEELC